MKQSRLHGAINRGQRMLSNLPPATTLFNLVEYGPMQNVYATLKKLNGDQISWYTFATE